MIPSGMEDYFNYLEDLRESGAVNMFGAAPYLAEEFGIDKRKAREILSLWMHNYDPEDYGKEE